ncbi:MAG TPA: response regulator [Sandaracinaceae bacterium LLY-WYZ-13_1]|nr:response regulator [Sandaracinaceae bacterium LLY-WYZ-13_1]
MRVLVVDDEPLIGTTLRILLDEHDVRVVTSGGAARDLLREDASFDVILCDLMLDDLSGMELSRWLERERPQAAERLVFMTGGAFTEEARDFLRDVPRARQLEKPFSSEEIHRLLDAFGRDA